MELTAGSVPPTFMTTLNICPFYFLFFPAMVRFSGQDLPAHAPSPPEQRKSLGGVGQVRDGGGWKRGEREKHHARGA